MSSVAAAPAWTSDGTARRMTTCTSEFRQPALGRKRTPTRRAPHHCTAACAPTAPVDIAIGDSPVKGPKNAPITILEFYDFQCPFCSRVLPTLKQLEDDYKGKIRISFKNAPLGRTKLELGHRSFGG